MTIKVGNQKLRLGLVEVGTILFPSHEATGHGFVPSSLGFIKNDNPIAGRSSIAQTVITKVVHVLNEGFHLLANFTLADFFLNSFLTVNFITGQGFSQHSNKRTIPGQKDSMGLLMFIALLGRDIEPNQRFPGTWNTCNKDDMLFAITGGFFD